MTREPQGRESAAAEERPPLGTWRRLYLLVLVALAVDIVLLAWLTERFR